jgi:hypothetical protein
MTWTKWMARAALLAAVAGAGPAAFAGEIKVEDIAGRMGGVVDELGRKQTGTPVQGEQKAIVGDLDALIASLEQECSNCKGGIKRQGRGMKDSMISRGTGEMGNLANPNDGGKDWAQLSERERDRILQSMSEGFPPEYRTVLERYYRRLAEEKPAPANGEKPKEKEEAPPAEKP